MRKSLLSTALDYSCRNGRDAQRTYTQHPTVQVTSPVHHTRTAPSSALPRAGQRRARTSRLDGLYLKRVKNEKDRPSPLQESPEV